MKNVSPKTLTLVVLLLLLLNTGLVVFLVWGTKELRTPFKPGRPDNLEWMAKELKLSPAQKEKHKQLREEHFGKVKLYYDSLRQVKTALYTRVADSTIAEQDFVNYDAKVAHWQSIINRMTFEHFKQVRALLQPEQQANFDQFVQKMMQRSRRDSSRRQ